MSYFEDYIEIIHHRQQNPLPEGVYGERHHIIPRSCGGSNEEWNLVRLTPEEHYKCHYLLTFIYATGEEHDKVVYAWNRLSNRIKGDFISVEEYGRLKRECAIIISKSHKGKPAWNKNKTGYMSQAGRQSLSEANKGNTKHLGKNHSDETRKKISEAKAGKPSPKKGKPGVPKTEEQKQRQREAMLRYWSAKKLCYERQDLPPAQSGNNS